MLDAIAAHFFRGHHTVKRQNTTREVNLTSTVLVRLIRSISRSVREVGWDPHSIAPRSGLIKYYGVAYTFRSIVIFPACRGAP